MNNRCRRSGWVGCRFSIDRKAFFQSSLERQEAKDLALQQVINQISEGRGQDGPLDVRSSSEVEALVTAAGDSRLVILFLYSSTCGVCKQASTVYDSIVSEAMASRARVVFLKHNIHDEYDIRTDLSRLHKVRSVPCFLFLDDGAVIERLSLRDIRAMGEYGQNIHAALSEDVKRLHTTYRKFLFRRAPGARS